MGDYSEGVRVNSGGVYHSHNHKSFILEGGGSYAGAGHRYETYPTSEGFYVKSASAVSVGVNNHLSLYHPTSIKEKEFVKSNNRLNEVDDHGENYLSYNDGYEGVYNGAVVPHLHNPVTYPSKSHFQNNSIKMESQEEQKTDLNIDDENSSSLDDRPLAERSGKHGKQDPKLCGVCGDKALGNNFNAITCESCKAFFRRNALRTKEFVCPFNDNCKVDPVTRRFCQKCRLKKCFDIGMRKEWIMTDEEKKMKKQKIEQNRLKRSSSESQPPVSGEVTAPKVPAVGEEIPEKLNGNVSSDSSSSSSSYSQSAIKPMMPHNNNTIPQPPPEPSLHLSSRHPPDSTLPVDNSRLTSSAAPTTNDLISTKVDVVNHSQTNSNVNSYDTDTSRQNQSPQAIWPENLGGQATCANPISVTKSNDNYFNAQSDHVIVASNSTPFQTHVVYPVTKEIPINSDLLIQGDQDPRQMPLLSSLIRPGVAESPPDAQLRESSTSSFPESPEDEGVHVHEVISASEKSVDNFHHYHHVIESPESLHSPAEIPQLTDARIGSSYDDEDVSPMNHSSSRDSSFSEELAPLPLNTMDSILSVAISAEFNAFGVLGQHRNPHSKELNKAEKAKLNELFFASQALNAPVDADGPIKIETSDPSLINVINLTDIAIRRLIKMSKKMCAFKNMCQEDQIALLKGGCTEMMILRSVVSYDPERDSWNIPHSNGYNIKLGVLKEARGNLYEEHQRFVKSFKAEWRSDDNIMIILCAITLFTPERPNVIHKDVVKLEQDSYYYLLKRYLESTRNGCEARSTYLQLIQKIAELHVLNSNHLRVFLEVNPREVEPLLIEIFDLKQ